jgi:hypothetical protein
VGSAAVIGDERSRRSPGKEVAVHTQGEGEQALGDALCEPTDGLGEVVAESDLAFEVREHGLDRESDPRLLELDRRALPEPVALGSDELDLDELERAVIAQLRTTPSTKVVLAITLDRKGVSVGILEPGDSAAAGTG